MADVTVPLLGRQARVVSAFPNHGQASLTHSGAYVLYSIGHQNPNLLLGFYGNLPVPALVAVGGAQTGVLALPSLTLKASGTVTFLGQVTGSFPVPTLVASGVSVQLGKAQLVYSGNYSLVAQGGATARLTLPHVRGQLLAHGITGSSAGTGSAAGGMQLPSLTLVASGSAHAVGRLVATLPALQFVPSGTMRGGSTYLPRLTLRATGGPAVTVEYEAYSVSLFSDQQGDAQAYVTHYTNYPFEQIVRYGTKYFGVAKTGLFELTGDLFDDQPIIAFLRTGETDDGSRMVKRPTSLYVAGRLGGDFVAAVTPSELKDYGYHYHTFDKTGARNYRVLFGKGLRARYLAYTFTNLNGEAFDLDEITPEVAELRRTA